MNMLFLIHNPLPSSTLPAYSRLSIVSRSTCFYCCLERADPETVDVGIIIIIIIIVHAGIKVTLSRKCCRGTVQVSK